MIKYTLFLLIALLAHGCIKAIPLDKLDPNIHDIKYDGGGTVVGVKKKFKILNPSTWVAKYGTPTKPAKPNIIEEEPKDKKLAPIITGSKTKQSLNILSLCGVAITVLGVLVIMVSKWLPPVLSSRVGHSGYVALFSGIAMIVACFVIEVSLFWLMVAVGIFAVIFIAILTYGVYEWVVNNNHTTLLRMWDMIDGDVDQLEREEKINSEDANKIRKAQMKIKNS